MKNIIRLISPPILYKTLSRFYNYLTPSIDQLFDGDDLLFKQYIASAKIYAEYGCGASTVWVYNNSNVEKIFCVDSSEMYINQVQKTCTNNQKISFHYANIGKVGDWGVPLNYGAHHNFEDYTNWIWQQSTLPDVVLIDGRFRVCCFLTSLLHAREGTFIFFDDYTNREHYQIVEKFIKPINVCGRQALFVTPHIDNLNIEEILIFIRHFRFVRE